MKELSESDLAGFERQLAAAVMSLDRREARVMAVYDRLEAGLVILGATAIEDRLQPGGGDTLGALARAGVRVWILTGDKKETAVSISLASGHLDPDMELADLTGLSTSGLLTSKLQSFHEQAKLNQGQVGLIVDGETFAMISGSNRMSGLFVKVCILFYFSAESMLPSLAECLLLWCGVLPSDSAAKVRGHQTCQELPGPPGDRGYW